MKTEREKLYDIKKGLVTVKMPFEPLLLSAFGYFNPLKDEDRPDLKEVQRLKDILGQEFGISL